MVVPIIILVAIPIFLGMVYVPPFEQPEELNDEVMLEPEFNDKMVLEPDTNILYFILIGIWTIIFLRMLLQIKKGTFKVTKRY